MKKKSILLIGNYPPPYGGVPRHIEYLVPHLVNEGWDTHVLSSGDSGIEQNNGYVVYKDNREQFKKLVALIHFFVKIFLKKPLTFLKLLKVLPPTTLRNYINKIVLGAQIIEKQGISVISAYNMYTGAPVGLFLGLIYDLPLVVTNFGEFFDQQEFFDNHPKFIPLICKVVDRFVSMTQHCAKSYQLVGASPQVEVISIGIDVVAFAPDNDGSIIRQQLGIEEANQIVLFVGRMVREMGLHTVLAATPSILETRPDIRLIIVGQRGHLFTEAAQFVDAYPGQFFVIPDVPLHQLPSYYAAATVVVAPTLSDRACGTLASAEAMATGKPVVAANVGGIPEFVAHGETGILIPPDDPLSLAQVTLDLLSDVPHLQQMGRKGRARVEALFDRGLTNQRYERLFREVVGIL